MNEGKRSPQDPPRRSLREVPQIPFSHRGMDGVDLRHADCSVHAPLRCLVPVRLPLSRSTAAAARSRMVAWISCSGQPISFSGLSAVDRKREPSQHRFSGGYVGEKL
jgi:hypothetical protein